MADEKHLQLLRKGVKDWNEWRLKCAEADRPSFFQADLSHADLSSVDLSGAYLYRVNLVGANLSSANLSKANISESALIGAVLTNTVLTDADLSASHLDQACLSHASLDGAELFITRFNDADLTGANISMATLSYTDLSGADLTGADIRMATLSGVTLSDAKLEGSLADHTMFDDLDLRGAKGLDAVSHKGSSSVSISTIYKSAGKIPEVFLRGCGVPESFIVQIPSLVAAMSPIQFYSCFISYSSKDEELAQRLHADLQSRGVRCWFAPENLKIGERFRRQIDEVIRVYDRLLLILSEHSVASSWVEKEVETAMESEDEQKRTILFPVRLDDTVMDIKTGWPADVRRTRHIGDFRRWKEHDEYQKAFTRLLADLKASA